MANKGTPDLQTLLQMAKLVQNSGGSEEEQSNLLREMVLDKMSGSQGEALNKILSDADAVDNLMKSEQAQRILKSLSKKK